MVQGVLAMMGQSPGEAQGGGSQFLIAMALIFGVMYFLLIRPQRKEQQRHESLLKQIKKGDRVITTGGLLGKVLAVREDQLALDLGNKVKVDVLRSAIRGLQDPGKKGSGETDSAG